MRRTSLLALLLALVITSASLPAPVPVQAQTIGAWTRLNADYGWRCFLAGEVPFGPYERAYYWHDETGRERKQLPATRWCWGLDGCTFRASLNDDYDQRVRYSAAWLFPGRWTGTECHPPPPWLRGNGSQQEREH